MTCTDHPGLAGVLESQTLDLRAAAPGSGDTDGPMLKVQVSIRHMHICRAHMDALFGPGSELTFDHALYQEGYFAAKETVTIVGRKGRSIPNLRLVGPMRAASQVEIAFTDAIALGLPEVPFRVSGNVEGSPGALLIGPAGRVHLERGLIRTAIHVHMNPAEAAHFGVVQGDRMHLRIAGPCGLTFDNVHVRVDPRWRLNVHMDTDEANACGLHLAHDFELFK